MAVAGCLNDFLTHAVRGDRSQNRIDECDELVKTSVLQPSLFGNIEEEPRFAPNFRY